jgi:hypothetical protein
MALAPVAKAALTSAALLFLGGCASLDDGRRRVEVETGNGGFARVVADSGPHQVLALLRSRAAAETLTVYLEGDGAAWPGRWQPPLDPTPDRALVLDMAVQDASSQVAYLARPCQYLDALALAACPVELWTRRRYSDPAVAAMDAALAALKRASGASRLQLVGYSGGGVMALALAARRADVTRVVTVAAPLRVGAWVAHHGLTPLEGVDPDALVSAPVPAVHFVGERDEVVPVDIVAPYARRTGAKLVVVPGFDHHCCWSRDWPRLLEETR